MRGGEKPVLKSVPLFAVVPRAKCLDLCRIRAHSGRDDRIFHKFLRMMMNGRIKMSKNTILMFDTERTAEIVASGLDSHFGARCSVLPGCCVSLKCELSEEEIERRMTHWKFYLAAKGHLTSEDIEKMGPM